MFPDKKSFLKAIDNTGIPVIYKEITYSLPYYIYEHFLSPNSILFESIKGTECIARYSFIGFDPLIILKTKNLLTEIISNTKIEECNQKPLRILKNLLFKYPQKFNDKLPPFQGGFAGMFGYDFVQYFEKLPQNAFDDLYIPDAHFMLFDKVIAFDHKLRKCWIIASPGVDKFLLNKNSNSKIDWSEEYDISEFRIQEIEKKILNNKHRLFVDPGKRGKKIDIVYEMSKKEYMDIVKRAKDYIAAGDIFQANLSQRVSAYIENENAFRIYKILRSINPSPFAAYVDFGNYRIISSSPERLVKVKNHVIETRPIAGTRPRGKTLNEDEEMRADLLLNEKERAEHIMLIDLERNDLGKVSEYGTVKVDEMMITEDYSHVIHIVSNIKGKLVRTKDCFDVVRATFPGGTITGVPKVRCMEIIDELEPVRRGPYTGSLGYMGFSGNMDLNIIIRTFVIRDNAAYVQAGAGIVADSDPEREYFETLKKAEALIKTLELV